MVGRRREVLWLGQRDFRAGERDEERDDDMQTGKRGMSGVVLHHVPFSRSFRVLWLLEELGIERQVVDYDIRDGSMRKGALPGMSPAARVPALEIDGMTLFESGAIVEYLCETRREAELAPMPGDPERAEYLQWVHYAETMGTLVEQLNINRIFLRDPAQASATVIRLTTARLRATLLGMEARLKGDWLLSRFSGADVMMSFNLFAAPYFVKFDEFPKLSAYRDRLASRPAFVSAREADGPQSFYDREFYPLPEAT